MMNATPASLRVETNGPLTEIVLARPEVRNAFDDGVIAELTAALRTIGADSSRRAVILRGDGPVFCAGADINWMRRLGAATREENEADALRLSGLFTALTDIPVPTICVAHGAALGGGAGLVAASDIAIAEEGCKFGFTEVRLGIVPAVISEFALPAIGARHARRYFATGEIFDAARAAEMGLVSEVVTKGGGLARARAIATQLLTVGPVAVREARRIVDRLAPRRDPATTAWLAATIARVRATDEAREGLAAFIEKRAPAWAPTPEGPR